MTCDIVIKSYPKDYHWLDYCLRSIQKFATGFNDVIVMLPREAPLPLTKEKVVLLDVPENYLSQQVAKLNADHHTKADYILHFDSDMIFTRPVTPDFFFTNGKPAWAITEWGDMPGKVEMLAWYHVMAKLFLQTPPYEFMRKCAILAPRWLYAELRAFIQDTHGITMESYVMNQPGNEFSEYNALGFLAWLKFRDKFHWHDTEKEGCEWPFRQYWSHSGMKHEGRSGPTSSERLEIERILA